MNPQKIRWVEQREAYCGPATLEMLFSFYGETITQDDIVETLGVKDSIVQDVGTSILQLSQAVNDLAPDYTLMVKYNSCLDDLIWLTCDLLLPAGVEWRGRFLEPDGRVWEEGHYSVVTGIDSERKLLHIIDPEPKDVLTPNDQIGFGEFERRWWDDNRIWLPGSNSGVKETIRNRRMIFVLIPEKRAGVLHNQGWRPASAELMIRCRFPGEKNDFLTEADTQLIDKTLARVPTQESPRGKQ